MLQDQRPTRVAIKRFVGKGGLDAQVAWNKEKEALARMQPHKHLNDRVAAVVIGDQYLLISKWADGGDLNKFWRNNPTVDLNASMIRDVLLQFQGLAHALQSVHGRTRTTFQDTNGDSMDTEPTSSGSIPQIVAPDDDNSSNWRHGDLKPANIFIFREGSAWLGTLKIGDLGLAKMHAVATARRSTPSSTEHGTHAYEPPEAVTGLSKPRSRLYDIWSFGCVLMEMIVWLLYGYEGLQALWAIPTFRWKETLYYTILENNIVLSAVINRSMQQVIDNILKFDPECNKPQGSVLRDLIILARDKLLVVALPDPNEATQSGRVRIDAGMLVQELTRLVNKSSMPDQSRYLWTGLNRGGVNFKSVVKLKDHDTSQQFLSAPSPMDMAVGNTTRHAQHVNPNQSKRANDESLDLTRLHLQDQDRLKVRRLAGHTVV